MHLASDWIREGPPRPEATDPSRLVTPLPITNYSSTIGQHEARGGGMKVNPACCPKRQNPQWHGINPTFKPSLFLERESSVLQTFTSYSLVK